MDTATWAAWGICWGALGAVLSVRVKGGFFVKFFCEDDVKPDLKTGSEITRETALRTLTTSRPGINGEDGSVSVGKLLWPFLGEWLEIVGIALPSVTRGILTSGLISLALCEVFRFNSPGSRLGIGCPTGGSLVTLGGGGGGGGAGFIWAGEDVVSTGDGYKIDKMFTKWE